ncbi:MAG: immunity 22 family protein [Oscillospiraceae bacterium]|nr:immunity 22 family protein [Oscillospiraceae bacterium]
MEQEGYVSIWLGNFPDNDALWEYASESHYDDDGNAISTPFGRDFFDGEYYPFDTDFWEREVVEPSNDLAKLVEPFSYGDTFEVAGIKLDKTYNAVILVYDFEYEPEKIPADAAVEFIAAVPYDNSDPFIEELINNKE